MSNIKIMSFNIAAETLCTNNNAQNIISIIRNTNPDILGIQEINCHNETTNQYLDIELYKLIAQELKYEYMVNDHTHTVIFSKYPIIDTSNSYRGIVIKINNNLVAVFNIHLTDEPYQPYQIARIPYGDYPFITLEQEAINQANEARGEYIQKVLGEIKYTEDKHKLTAVIVLGDFNEPSHRDWVLSTVNAKMKPLKVDFPSVKTFETRGFIDSFRDRYPNPVINPGYTWPTPSRYSESEIVEDRIDYILVKGDYMKILDAGIIGEKEFKNWPSDHRACICVIGIGSDYYTKYLKYKNKYLKLKKFKQP